MKAARRTTMANLSVIFSNDQPKREEKYPRIRLLYKNKDTIEIHVQAQQPHSWKRSILNRGAVVHMRQRANANLDLALSSRRGITPNGIRQQVIEPEGE
jgi:hypothetical protein